MKKENIIKKIEGSNLSEEEKERDYTYYRII